MHPVDLMIVAVSGFAVLAAAARGDTAAEAYYATTILISIAGTAYDIARAAARGTPP